MEQNNESFLLDPVVEPTQHTEKDLKHKQWLDRAQINLNSFMQSQLAGRITSVGGNDTEEFSIPGVSPNDFLKTNMHTTGAGNVSIVSSKCLQDKISVTFSGNPGNDTIFDYFITKAG